ncbi:MAG: adenylyltransferase/cytidyltransferase family protein [Candidatus Delongbacteria bacterium]|jgi:glycerol-3-phosphate cytidylyltransferase|nr:adenylyltransferase/cytidyltransferase family protein [Candidatus Delongbacteria bacterium]
MCKKKYKIGYTTGVFDLFHIGHLNIIKKAKEQCEHLIVGVSTDELVKSYKNKIPVIPYEERVEIVRSCRYVDEVVPQINRDKFAAFEKYGFDAMFVGDDWKGKPLFKEVEKKLKENGSDVVYFPYTKNTSSTIIREILDSFKTES